MPNLRWRTPIQRLRSLASRRHLPPRLRGARRIPGMRLPARLRLPELQRTKRVANRARTMRRLPGSARAHPKIASTLTVLAIVGIGLAVWLGTSGGGDETTDGVVADASETQTAGEQPRVGDASDQQRDQSSQSVVAPYVVPDILITPDGPEVARLSPIAITFKRPPPERDAEKLFAVEPAVEGAFTWLTDRRALFQPSFPGLARGVEYVVRVPASASGLAEDVEHVFTVEGRLVIQTVIPADGDTDVPAETQVLVQFSRSVAPLTLLSARTDDPVIEFEPALPGSGEWLNTSLYRFLPDAIEPSTTYTARIRRGLSSASDGVLEEDFVWSFTTNQPQVVATDPADNTIFVPPDQKLLVTFDQPMNRASVEAGVRFRDATSRGTALDITASWNTNSTELTLTPADPLDLNHGYEIFVPAGLLGLQGGETQQDRAIRFTSIDLPKIERTSPRDGERGAGRFGINIVFNNPMNEESFEGRITIAAIDANGVETPVEFDDDRGVLHSGGRTFNLSVSLEPSTLYVVRIAAGVEDRIGQRRGPDHFSFTTGAIDPSINFVIPSQISTYAAASEPILFFETINYDAITFDLYRLTDRQAATTIQNNRFSWRSSRGLRPPQAPIRSWEQRVEGEANTLTLSSTSLSGTGEPLGTGHYYVITNARFTPTLMFSVVDTTLVTKLSVDEFLVWALDYETGEPLVGVPIQIDPVNGGRTVRTASNGLASFSVPPPNRSSSQERVHTAKVDTSDRFGVGSSRWSQGTEPHQLDLPIEFYPREFVGHLFTDRPIYRPGETVFYKGTLRLDDDARYSIPDNVRDLDIVIRDPQFNELERIDVTVNAFGTFAAEFTLPPGADTGRYTLSIVRGGRQGFTVTSAQFRIAEFRTPEFEVGVTASAADYIDGDRLSADAEATFFFGGPLAGATANWAVLASPTAIRIEGFESYSFRDFDFFRRSELSQPLRAEGETVTDAAGVARISTPAELQPLEGTQRFDISVTVIDQNDQAVAGSTSVTVHPADYYAGIRPASYIARSGETATLNLVTVGIDGQLLANRAVTVEIFERKWVTTKELGPQGRFYRSEPVDTLIDTINVTTDADAVAQVDFLPARSGQLRVVANAIDTRGRLARSSTFLWVSGSGRASWRIRNDDVIELVANKDLYDVGDVAEILVPAPFEGAVGLVTVERGKIISRSVQQFETTSETIRIPILDRHVPNVFVSVVLYRPPTDADPVPRYNVGYVELPVSTQSRLLSVTIEPDRERTQPGETVRYDIHVEDFNGVGQVAEVSVAIVDKAVLSLAAEVGPDGLRAFWFQRGLGVRTSASVGVSIDRVNDGVIEAIQDGTKGGGSDDPDIRGDFRTTAFWTAQLVTDEDGNASVDVPLPDNLTTWRAQARAVSGDTLVGEGTSELLSTQPLLIRSALPRFFRVGDEATLRMLVRNATDAASAVSLSIEASGITIRGDLTQTMTIPAGESVTYAWPASVSEAGTAVFTFTARAANGLSDAIRLERPVHLDVTPETTATGGVVTSAVRLEAIYLPDYAIVDHGALEVSVQASLVGALQAELDVFRPRSLESVMSVANRVIATLGAARAEGTVASVARSSRISADVTRLIAEQRLDGGWSWCSNCPTDMMVSGWVLLALGDARDAGRQIDAIVVQRATQLIRQEITTATDFANPAEPNRRAFLLYAASSAGGAQLDGAMRALFQQNRRQLTNWGRSYLILGLRERRNLDDSSAMRTLINDLSAGVIPSANGNHWEDPVLRGSMHNGSTRVTALALRALVAADPGHPLIEETARWLVTARDAQRHATAVERAQAIASLGDFAGLTGERRGNYDYSVTLDNSPLLGGHFQPGSGENVAGAFVPLTGLTPGGVSIISFEREASAPGRLYYGLNLRYVTPAREVEALNRGFAVSHEYSLLDEPDRRVESAELGDVIRVRVTIIANADRKFVTVEDFLPAGLEPIDPQLDIVPIELRRQLQQERSQAILANAPDYVAPWYAFYFNPWDQVNVRDDRVELRAGNLPKGVHEYIYFARATAPGDYFVAPTHAEETFFPEVFGRSDSGRFAIVASDE